LNQNIGTSSITIKYFMKYSEGIRKLILANFNQFKAGVESYFVPLDKKCGAKLFHTQDQLEYAYNLQKLFCQHGLGPQTGDQFEIPGLIIMEVKNGNGFIVSLKEYKTAKIYGYLTQTTNPPSFFSDRFYDRMNTLCRKIRTLGYDPNGLHEYDVGYINNKLVVVDFGKCSLVKY